MGGWRKQEYSYLIFKVEVEVEVEDELGNIEFGHFSVENPDNRQK